MNKSSLYDKLIEYAKEEMYALHMPGHKRNLSLLEGLDPFDVDITEIHNFDNLHYAQGVIKEATENASTFLKTDKTWFLVNGSSCGILSAISAVADIGDYIIIGRNCHISVYHAAILRNLQVDYLYPEVIPSCGISGGYNPEDLRQLLEMNRNVKAVVITSPTYEGVVSDVQKLAEIAHAYGAVLIVDEAHGAHFGVGGELPMPAYQLGADLVIESVHKTLPALTQTALLHYCDTQQNHSDLPDKVEEALRIFETSSPSYLLMASIDKCIRQLQKDGKAQMEKLLITIEDFRNNVNQLKYFHVLGKEVIGKNQVFDLDLTKLVIAVNSKECSGIELADILRERYHFEVEMATQHFVLAIMTVADKPQEIVRLEQCLRELDYEWAGNKIETSEEKDFKNLKNEIKYSMYEAKHSKRRTVSIEQSKDRVSAEFLYLYPPGIPILAPGEVISEELLNQIACYKKNGRTLSGLRDKNSQFIEVIEL